ncbi:MAG: response regulator receiver [Syntrophaceae bacterium]|nr:MAG: response regulator receiver [Syntrophaceae bacterium]
MKESENKYRLLADNVSDVIFILDMNLNYTYISPSVKFLRGYEPEEALKQPAIKTLTPTSWDLARKTLSEVMELEKSEHPDIPISRTLQLEVNRKDGTTVWTEMKFSFIRNEDQQPVGILGVTRDITDRRRMEDELRESEEKYRTLFENAGEAIFVAQGGKLVFLNPKTAMLTGYSREEFASMPFVEFIYTDDRDMVMDRYLRRLNGENIPRQYSFRVIHKNGDVRWVELETVRINWKGKPATLNFMGDITNRKQTEEQLLASLEQLRRAVKTTIQVMGSAVESRDPYTAGHQIRSADLARAIATEMGLPQEKIDGIRMAGSIHDIGKLSIPAEILAKPTKLHEIEFSLIKEHARIGYEMLKDVESPWPLAEIVYQHHERLDGSGYPRHLKGEEICMEARIMAVADVVEAMASHRPYRPSLGIDAAMKEIEKNSGILYDPDVVDTCLRLFHEKGYQFD